MLAPKKGSPARVVKGRKVAVGTTGIIIWTGDGNYGPRVGLKDDSGQVHWTAASNCERIFPNLVTEAEMDWVAFERERAECLPRKGDIVRKGEFVGTIFWMRGERLGIRRLDALRASDEVEWANADEVTVVERNNLPR
jgi:hypothetical protein